MSDQVRSRLEYLKKHNLLDKHDVSASGSNELLCGDRPITRTQINNLERLLEHEQHQKMCVSISVLEPMTNDEWKRLKEFKPELFDFIKNAISHADT